MFGRKSGEARGSSTPEVKSGALDLEPEHYPTRENNPFSYTSEVVEVVWDGREDVYDPYVETRFYVGGIEIEDHKLRAAGLNVSPKDVYECSLQAGEDDISRMREAAQRMQQAAVARLTARQGHVMLREDQEGLIRIIETEYWAAIEVIVQPELDRQRLKAELARTAELLRQQEVLGNIDEILGIGTQAEPNE